MTKFKNRPKLSQLNEPIWLFPFHVMEIGNSFFIPTMKPAAMIYALDSGAKREQIKIKTFITMKDKVLGVRAWRVG